jgi:hypothetical protein
MEHRMRRIQITEMVWDFRSNKFSLQVLVPGAAGNTVYFGKATAKMRSDEPLIKLTLELVSFEDNHPITPQMVRESIALKLALSAEPDFCAFGDNLLYPNKLVTTLVFKITKPTQSCYLAQRYFDQTIRAFRGNIDEKDLDLSYLYPDVTQRTLVEKADGNFVTFGRWMVRRYYSRKRS